MRSPRRTLTPTWRPVIISMFEQSSDGADITSSEVNDDIVLWHRLVLKTRRRIHISERGQAGTGSTAQANEAGSAPDRAHSECVEHDNPEYRQRSDKYLMRDPS
jgi:hypothetical protein